MLFLLSAAKIWRRDDVSGVCNTIWKERIALKSNFIEISVTGIKGSPKSQTLQRTRCLTRTYWVSADIFPYELEAKCWVYLWKQTGPYISLGITEISCINTAPSAAARSLLRVLLCRHEVKPLSFSWAGYPTNQPPNTSINRQTCSGNIKHIKMYKLTHQRFKVAVCS